MKIKMCNTFYYRVEDEAFLKQFNTSSENILRNNNLNFYCGEMVRITLNDYKIHTVLPIETIKSICEKYGITEELLKIKNNLKSDKLFIGQQLKIYTCQT